MYTAHDHTHNSASVMRSALVPADEVFSQRTTGEALYYSAAQLVQTHTAILCNSTHTYSFFPTKNEVKTPIVDRHWRSSQESV
jgi:hypothetical protein